MPSSVDELKRCYQQLLALKNEQLFLLNQSQNEETMDNVNQLSERWVHQSLMIEGLIAGIGGYHQLEQSDNEYFSECINQLTSLNESIELILNSQYQEDSTTMQKVKMQQTTLRSYGGLGFKDSVSLYFDEKQ